jgi:two-component system, chemotaxis family, chemotaxis protein CheY
VKLLIVDDSAPMRRELLRRLPTARYEQVLEARDGFEALELFRQHLPELVTLDLTLPELDGLTCLTQMLALRPSTRVMVISALSDPATAIEAVERGAAEYVFKPFTQEELDTAFQSLVGVARG